MSRPESGTAGLSGMRATKVWHRSNGNEQQWVDQLAVEEPLRIEINGQPVLTTMRTPGQDGELAAGWLLAEGLIRERADIAALRHCEQDAPGNL